MGIFTISGILFIAFAGLTCGYAVDVEQMNNEYFQSTYGFQTGDTCWSHFGAGTQWSNFGAGTQWSNFGACVTPKTTTTTVGMQKTGITSGAIALALLFFTVGLILPRIKQFRDLTLSLSTFMIHILNRS